MLIVFDLDDTLIDTSGTITPFKMQCMVRMLTEQGIHLGENPYEEAKALNERCKTSKEMVHQLLERYSALHLLGETLALYTSPLPTDFSVPTTPDAKKVLNSLNREIFTLTLVTGGVRSFQLEKMEKAGLEHSNFSKIVVPEDSKKGPHYEDLLKEFSITDPQEALVVGDRIWMDLAPAHALGMRTVHMRWGRGLKEQEEEWIDHSITSLNGLLKLL